MFLRIQLLLEPGIQLKCLQNIKSYLDDAIKNLVRKSERILLKKYQH